MSGEMSAEVNTTDSSISEQFLSGASLASHDSLYNPPMVICESEPVICLNAGLLNLYSRVPEDNRQAILFALTVSGLGTPAAAEISADTGLTAFADSTGSVFRGLETIRLAKGAAIAARLDINGESYIGTNLARGNAPIKGTMSFFVEHAEGDAFAQALRAGDISGQSGTMYVTRAAGPCGFCVASISAAARSSGLKELLIYTPKGFFGIYTPETGLVLEHP